MLGFVLPSFLSTFCLVQNSISFIFNSKFIFLSFFILFFSPFFISRKFQSTYILPCFIHFNNSSPFLCSFFYKIYIFVLKTREENYVFRIYNTCIHIGIHFFFLKIKFLYNFFFCIL